VNHGVLHRRIAIFFQVTRLLIYMIIHPKALHPRALARWCQPIHVHSSLRPTPPPLPKPRRVCARPQAAVHRDHRRLARLDKRTGHEVLGRALHAAIAAVAAGLTGSENARVLRFCFMLYISLSAPQALPTPLPTRFTSVFLTPLPLEISPTLRLRVLPQACSIRRGITELVASVLFQFHF
jgi:hypothetical protein